MISQDAVIWAYRLLLGREPESPAVIEEKTGCTSIQDLVFEFLKSGEFKDKLAGVQTVQTTSEDNSIGELPTEKEIVRAQVKNKIETYFNNDSRFWSITSVFDCCELVLKYVDWNRTATPGHITNFLGVAMNVDFMPTLNLTPNSIDVVPIPANYHADLAEWATILRAVELATETFACIELGCGWGACLNSAGRAARQKNLKLDLIGVEGSDLNRAEGAH